MKTPYVYQLNFTVERELADAPCPPHLLRGQPRSSAARPGGSGAAIEPLGPADRIRYQAASRLSQLGNQGVQVSQITPQIVGVRRLPTGTIFFRWLREWAIRLAGQLSPMAPPQRRFMTRSSAISTTKRRRSSIWTFPGTPWTHHSLPFIRTSTSPPADVAPRGLYPGCSCGPDFRVPAAGLIAPGYLV